MKTPITTALLILLVELPLTLQHMVTEGIDTQPAADPECHYRDQRHRLRRIGGCVNE